MLLCCCADLKHSLRILYERNPEYNNKISAYYTDYETSFNHVDCTKLTTILSGESGHVKQGVGAHLTKPGWSNPHTIPHPTNLALFGHKITLYGFNQGGGSYFSLITKKVCKDCKSARR